MAPPLGMAMIAIGVGLFPGAWAARPQWQQLHSHVPSESLSTQGRGNFSKDCAPFPGQRVVLVTVSMQYFDMFRNWLVSARPFLQDTEHVHVIAEDGEVVPLLEALRKGHSLDYSVEDPHGLEYSAEALIQTDPSMYDSAAYGGVVLKRPNHLLKLLKKNCSVLYVDVDTVWMQDPFHEIEAAGSSDLYLTDDEPTKRAFWGKNYCTCFMYIQPAAWCQTLMQGWASRITGNTNQLPFNSALRWAVLTYASDAARPAILPLGQFPPGGVVLGKLGGFTASPHPTVFHANWLWGIKDKVDFFEERKLWAPTSLTA